MLENCYDRFKRVSRVRHINRTSLHLMLRLALLSQMVLNLPVKNAAFRLNITSIHQTTSPSTSTTNNSSSNTFYPNHRMTPDESGANQSAIDRQAADSILRPQLALQIYTHAPANSQEQKQSAPASSQPDTSSSNTVRAGYQQPQPSSSSSSSSSSSPPVKRDNDSKQSNRYNLITSASSNQQANRKYLLSPSAKQAEVWQYETSEQTASNSNNNVDETQAENGDPENALPMINAIITLPAPSASSSSHHQVVAAGLTQPIKVHSRQQQDDTVHQPTNVSATVNVERAISRLLDSQASGNIEFSMNMNGDEIVINPISKHGTSILASSLTSSSSSNNKVTLDGAGDDPTSSYVGRRYARFSRQHQRPPSSGATGGDRDSELDEAQQLVNRALRRHISSELAGDEQSASEIDTIDGNANNNNNNNNNDHLSEPATRADNNNNNVDSASSDGGDVDEDVESIASASSGRSSKKTSDYDNQALLDSRPRNSFWKSLVNSDHHTNNREAIDNDNFPLANEDDQQIVDETINHLQGRDKYNKIVKSSNFVNDDEQQLEADVQARSKLAGQNTRSSSAGRQLRQPSGRRRQTASSKRRAQFRDSPDAEGADQSDSDRSNYNTGRRQARNNDMSTVVIKGEDVKKFEKLLENLRSLTINNNPVPTQSGTKSSGSASRKSAAAAAKNSRGNSRESDTNDFNDNSGDQNARSALRDDNNENDAPARSDNNNVQRHKSRPSWTPQVNFNQHHHHHREPSGQGSPLAAKGSVQLRSFDSNVDIECDRRRQRSQKTSSASNDETSESQSPLESTPNIVDNDPMTSSDGNDEMNDESSQNIEQEESFDDEMLPSGQRHQPNMEASESDLSPQKSPAEPIGARAGPPAAPKSLFVRKTILQTYYDNSDHHNNHHHHHGADGNNTQDESSGHLDGSKRDNVDHLNSRGNYKPARLYAANQTFDSPKTRAPLLRLHRFEETPRAEMAPDRGSSTSTPSSSTSYIDYSNLDDREVFRGSESRKSKALAEAPSSTQQQQQQQQSQKLDRIPARSLQQVMDKSSRPPHA